MANEITDVKSMFFPHNSVFLAVTEAVSAIDDKFGKDIVAIDISGVWILADYLVVATAANASQLKAMADEVDKRLSDSEGLRLRHSEGTPASGWVLMDFGSLIVHLFTKEQRAFYDLERLWSDCKMVYANGEWMTEN